MQPGKRIRVIPFLMAVVLSAAAALAPPTAAAADNPIVAENLQPGTQDWQIPWGSAADDTTKQIKGYASAVSVNKGENITFYVSVSTPQTYTIDVYRIGWYQGLGGRLMAHAGPLSGVRQATCPTDATTGLIECRWTPSYTLTTQNSWTSGIYFALLTNAQGYRNYIVFTVRDDNRVADLLYQQPVTTYQAYNNYPNDGLTGKSLLDYKSYGANTVTGSRAAAKVSFDRPYANNGSGDDFIAYEIEFVRWLEQKGYDVTYSTNLDTHTNGERLLTYRGFLSVGYDAYYTKQMYDAVLVARDAGVHLGFFGANAMYWQARFEPSSTNVPNRVLVSYKNASIDPITDTTLKTVLWRDPLLNRPEQTLIGVQFASTVEWTPVTQFGTYVVNNSQNWVYAGTGFKDGDTVTGIVGWRADRFHSQYPGPNAVAGTYALLSHSTFTGDYSNSSVYQAASGAWVFATGSMAWTWALDNYAQTNLLDARIQKTTANVLDRFVAGSTQTSFAIAASPSSQTALPGSSTSYGLTITPNGGFAGDVTLSVGGLPPGASGTFSTNPAATTSTLSVTTPAGTPAGTYPLTITGVNGTLTRTTTVTLTVPGITVTAPNTAVSWNVGSTQAVSFTHNLGVGQTVDIDISRDGGASWSLITTVTTASATSGGFSWTVSGPATTQALIRATWASSTLVTDTSDVNFTVVKSDTTPPSTPIGLSATAISSSQIDLAWTGSTDDVAVAGYRIFRNGAQVSTSSTPSFSDTGLAASTSYTYAVSAYDAANNNSPLSSPVNATTLPSFDFALSSGGNTSVVRGSSVDNSITATLVSGATQPVTFSTSGLPSGATATYTPASCSPGCATTITIGTTASTPLATSTITVTGTAGSLLRSATFSLTVTAPADTTPPAVSLGASPANGSTIGATVTLSATASDNVGVVGVQFLLDGANLGAENTTSPYSISWNTATAAQGPHALSARARDEAGNTAVATAVNVIVDNQPPTGTITINGGAAATNNRTSTLTLAATDNAGPVTHMRFSATGTSFSAEEVYATTKTWTLSIGAGTKTVYVQFRDAVGNWSGSFTDTIVLDTTAPTVSGVAATNVTNGSATITWTTSEPATSQVEYGPTISYGGLTEVDTTLVTAHSATLTGLNPQTTYNYRVRSVDAAGNQRIGTNLTFTTLAGPPDATPPSIPTNLAAVAVSATQINLSWNVSTDNVAVAGYRVLRNGIQIATVGVLSYASVGLSPNTTYTYTVAAYDAQNNVSPQSAPASATTAADTTAPTVSITSPAGGGTVSGTIIVTANASDNAGIAGVTFTVDGSTIGTEDTSSPYSVSLDTKTLSDGAHTLSAIARDTSNFSATSAPVSILVNSTAPPMMIRYVNTASTVGGDGTTNATTGANRAFRSLLDAINSLPAVLTMPVVIYCDGAGGPDTTPVNQQPFDMVTSAANYLLITTNAANRATVPHDPARYTLMGTNTSVLYNNIPSHIRIDGIQVQLTISNGGTFIGIKTSNANEVATDIDARISNTVVKCVVTSGNAIGFNTRFPSPGAGGNVSVWNSVAYGCTTGFNNDFPGAQYVNNTAFNNNFGYVNDVDNSMKVVNCLAAKGTKSGGIGFVGTFAAGSDFNAADDGNRIPGANSSSGRTFTFVNAAVADVHLAPTDTGAKDFGTTDPLLGKFGDDIDGVPRSGVWDIGADEVGS
jgi:chitodextrinase